MSYLSAVCVFLGILIIAGRASLIFAPEATLDFIRRVINNQRTLRIMGIPTVILGVVMIAAAGGHDHVAAVIILLLGWLIAVGGVCELVFTAFIQKVANFVWGMDTSKARIVGVVSVIVGVVFIYLGIWEF